MNPSFDIRPKIIQNSEIELQRIKATRGRSQFPNRTAHGFSLMEVLVGISIVGIVYATLFSLMTSSLRNISRIEAREKLSRLAQMKLNELVLSVNQVKTSSILSGRIDETYSWKAQVDPVRWKENLEGSRNYVLATIRLSIFWTGSSHERQEYSLETITWVPNKP